MRHAESTVALVRLSCAQGAVVSGNDVAGLVTNGSAQVTLQDSNFTDSARANWGGGALVVAGQSRVRIASSIFRNNKVAGRGDVAGGHVCQTRRCIMQAVSC